MKKGWIVILLSALIGGLTAFIVVKSTTPATEKVIVSSDGGGYRTVNLSMSDYPDFTYAAESAVDAVVYVRVKAKEEVTAMPNSIFDFFFFGTPQQEREKVGSGSGVIIREDGYIVTNNHVVEGATEIEVTLNNNKKFDAKLIGTDPATDVALIKVDAQGLPVIPFGDSDKLRLGEWVLAIGSPYDLRSTITAGIISAKGRSMPNYDGKFRIESFIQTDAAVNPGNSGGVLVNMKGEVVGINNAKLEDTSVEGMGYAIPISTAQDILTSLMNADSIPEGETAYLGIVGRTIDSQYSQALGMPSGAYVSQVVKGSPAEEAGIEAGDIITGFEGRDVSTMDGLKQRISLKKAGEKVEVTLQRANQNGEYQEQTVTVTLGKQSDYEDAETATEESADTTEQGSQRGTDPYEYYYNNGGGNYDNGGDYYSNPFDYFFN